MTPDVAAHMPAGMAPMMDSVSAMIGRGTLDEAGVAPALTIALPDLFNANNRDMLGTLEKDVQKQFPAVHPFLGANGRIDPRQLAVADIDPDNVKRMLSRGHDTQNLPGTDADWYGMAMLHENAHGKDIRKDGSALPAGQVELYADWQGYQDYYKGYKQGVFSDPEVPYAFQRMRALDFMQSGGKDSDGRLDNHINTVLAPLPGESFHLADHYTTAAAMQQDLVRARNDVMIKMGEHQYTDADMAHDTVKAVKEAMDHYGFPVDPALREQINARANPFVGMNDLMNGKNPLEEDAKLLQQIDVPDEYHGLIASLATANINQTKIDLGENLAKEQPELVYETARRMNAQGAFADNAAGKILMDHFIDGAQRYQPDHYSIAPEDRPTARPAIVDRLAEQFKPALAAPRPAQPGMAPAALN